MKRTNWRNPDFVFSTWENSEFGVRPGSGAARVVGQAAVRRRIRRLDPAHLQRPGRQNRQPGLGLEAERQVLPVLLPADDGPRVAGDLAAQQGGVTQER